MSLENDVNRLQEDDVFKPADKAELARREKERPPSADGLIRCINNEMSSDEEDNGPALWAFYQNASADERVIIDEVMMFICGWKMYTLYEKSQDPKYRDNY